MAFFGPGVSDITSDGTNPIPVGSLDLGQGGSLILMAKAVFVHNANEGDPPVIVQCNFEAGDTTGLVIDHSEVYLPSAGKDTPGTATVPFLWAVKDLPPGQQATLSCVGSSVSVTNVKITAMQVDNLTILP